MFIKAVALEEAYLDFILSRKAMLCTSGTLRFYKFTAGKFVEWLEVETLEEISTTHVRMYLSELAEKGLSDSYIHWHARAIRTILSFFIQKVIFLNQ